MIAILTDSKLEHLKKEIRYTCDLIMGSLGYSYKYVEDTVDLRETDVLLIYGFVMPTEEELSILAKRFVTIYIPADAELYDPKTCKPERLKKNLREIKLLSVTPVISAAKFDYPAKSIIDAQMNAGLISFDLIGNIFFQVARLEDKALAASGAENRDQGGVFEKYREIPRVDNLLWLLDSLIKEHTRKKGQYLVQKHYWPQGQEAAVLLTHSVDDLQKWDLASFFISLADELMMFFTMNWKHLWHTVTGKFKYLFTNIEPYWNFDEFKRLERDAGMKSTYFLATHSCDEIDYSLDDPDLLEEIKGIAQEGNEIGFLMTADKKNRDIQMTRKQVILHQLGRENVGVRQYDYEDDEDMLAIRQIISPSYSMSTARSEDTGYPQGIGLPYHPWLKTGKADHPEIGILFRDKNLVLAKHKLVNLEGAKNQLKKLYQAAVRTHGIFSLDMRIASYTDVHYCDKLYPYLLALLKTNRNWVTTGSELIRWWTARSQIVIEEGEYEFSVFFPADIDNLTLQITGDYSVVETDGPTVKIDGNTLRYSGVKANSVSIVRIRK